MKPDKAGYKSICEIGKERIRRAGVKIKESTIAGKKVLDVAHSFLIACFDENVTEETIMAIAPKKFYYSVMRDNSMANNNVVTNFEQIFDPYSSDTVRKVL